MEARNAALQAKEEAALAAAIAAANAAAARANQPNDRATQEWQEQEIAERSRGRDQALERREVTQDWQRRQAEEAARRAEAERLAAAAAAAESLRRAAQAREEAARAAEVPWWQRAWDGVRQAADRAISWVDQHQTAISLGVGVAVGIAAIALSAGAATPLVAAALAAGATVVAGGSVAAATVGLNAYYDRPLGTNVLRNAGLSAGAAFLTSGAGMAVRTGLAMRATYAVGGAIQGLCLRYPTACARAEVVLNAMDTAETIGLQVQLGVQTALRDPRAGETAIELQFELMDGGVPGNTFAREAGEEIPEIVARFGDEGAERLATLDASLVATAHAQGEGAVPALLGWSADDLAQFGAELAERSGRDAQALRALDRLLELDDLSSPEALELIDEIGMSSVQGSGDRFVIGRWVSHGEGYVNDARLDGGVFFETNPEIYQRLVDRFGRGDPRVQQILWEANQASIRQAIADGLPFDYSLARMDPERYARERNAVLLYAGGQVDRALSLLGTGTVPTSLREVELLLQAGYRPLFDDVAQVIHWLTP
jgi:VIT1/CCC1 family predicted Fe2+/Mn2+ transporter